MSTEAKAGLVAHHKASATNLFSCVQCPRWFAAHDDYNVHGADLSRENPFKFQSYAYTPAANKGAGFRWGKDLLSMFAQSAHWAKLEAQTA